MLKHQVACLVLISLLSSTLQNEPKEDSPFADIANEIMKEKNMENIGGMVNSFIQSDGAKQLMDGVLQNLANGNGGSVMESLGNMLNQKQSKDEVNPMELLSSLGSLMGGGDNGALLQGLGSLLATSNNGKKQDGPDAAALLQGLGSIVGAAAAGNQAGNGDGAGALLQGLGSMLSGGGKEGAGLNPEMIGNMINMFATTQETKSKTKKKKGKKTNKTNPFDGILSLTKDMANVDADVLSLGLKMAKTFAGPQLKPYLEPLDDLLFIYNDLTDKNKKIDLARLAPSILRVIKSYREILGSAKKSIGDDSMDMGNILNMASSFMNQGQGGSGFMEYMPMIMNTINAFTGQEAEDRAGQHASHSWSLPTILEKIHVYYDHFINSEIGKRVWNYLNQQKAFKVFHDDTGNFNYDKFEELIENHSFRKHWIEQVVYRLVDGIQGLVKEQSTSEYITTGVMFINSMLQNYGFPNKALLDLKNPTKSLTKFANFGAKKYLDAEIDATDYVEPVVAYVANLIQLAKTPMKPGDLADTLTDTINFEIIEPITRVNRAYRFAKNEPSCDNYVFCMINQKDSMLNPGNLPKLRRALYKGTSLAVGWMLSSHTGTSYWDLYAVIMQKQNCKKYRNDACNAFHHEEVKATTEYVHTEL